MSNRFSCTDMIGHPAQLKPAKQIDNIAELDKSAMRAWQHMNKKRLFRGSQQSHRRKLRQGF
jgi:hypothetical protein